RSGYRRQSRTFLLRSQGNRMGLTIHSPFQPQFCGVSRQELWKLLKAFADQWALVTGASSGIGAEFARQLAARGMHLVLVARREQLLTNLAAEVHQAHGTKTEIIVADLSDPGEPARLLEEVAKRGLTIEVLVNNVGVG